MRWSDERYVRFYTRDTPKWTMLPWESRGLFGLLLRAVDRAGILDLDGSGVLGIASALRMPVEAVEAFLPPLLKDGCVEMRGDELFIPNYMAAQETPQSDKARKRAERERARDGATSQPRETTEAVTPRHAQSQNVTLSHAEPSLAEPDQTHTSGARPRDEDVDQASDTMPVPTFTEDGLAALLGELPALATLAADPDLVTDLYGGFRMACGDAATADLARSAVGSCAAAEDLRSMPLHQQRERLGRYLGNARLYNRPSDRGSAPESVTEEQRVVLAVFGEEWAKRKQREFVQATGDGKHAASLVEAAKEHAGRLKIRPRDIFRHWAAAYVRDADKFVADQDHPLRLLPSRLTSYGLPRAPPAKKPKPDVAAAPVYVPPPANLLASIGRGVES